MRRSIGFFVFAACVFLAFSSANSGQYSDSFQQFLADQGNDAQYVSAIVTMADQVNLPELQDQLYAVKADRQTWHETVVRALQEKATLTQPSLLSRLETLMASGQVKEYRGFWVGNVVVVAATPQAFDEIVSRNDVLQISPNYEIEGIKPVENDGDEPIISSHEIGLTRIKADSCWAIGITGQGRLVSNIDTGVLGSHVALSDRWAGNDPRYAGHPEWAWLDPYTTNWPSPNDVNGHGTHTMGTICGRSDAGDTVGVAMDAQWIAAAAIDRGGGIPRTVADAITSFQWITDPDGDPGTVWDVPDVCSNSWGVTTSHGYDPCDDTFWSVIDGCEAAGVVVVFAAGNEGTSGPSTLRRPADRATTPYSTFAVGAVDGGSVSMPIASFSSRGPSNCTPDGSTTFKPEVSAPGVNVRSSYNNGGYTQLDGTSMACPHVAGVVALVRQANPNLTSEQVKQIIYETAVESSADNTPGEDNNYGNGVVNAYAAVQRAFAYLEGWGTLSGIITDQASGSPIQGATISILNRPWTAVSRLNGEYFIFMPADTAWTIRVDYSPTHLPIIDTVMVVENDTIFQDYALEGKVTTILTASFANPLNTSYRSFFIKGSWDEDGFWNGSWTAPPVEIRDNGVSPDQTAGDGIFTGEILLARDLTHTYAWAIYSESYGGEAARLQSGQGFQILNLNPPAVPTLAVNPSGSDNNWTITALGDNGLDLDLAQGVNNVPAKWGAAVALDSGTVYTFRFRVMHSTVASYGAGGIGGPDITFNCQYSGSYDFIFDDRDDSYIVQLTGTEGPPTSLSAVSGLDSHINLSWVSPVTRDVLAGFNLYRSINPNAYNGGDIAFRVNGTNLITGTSYSDWAGVLDSIQNGVLYYYQAAAVYDIGGGQFVEVGPSNEATGTAQNLRPYPPYNLQGDVNDRTISITWSFGDSARDLEHFNIYKRLMPQGDPVMVGSTTNQNYSFDIPAGEDGVYQVNVTAVDDGTPPLESAPSRPLLLAVGHLPPTTLTAISGQESSVPLNWSLPGSWRVTNPPAPPIGVVSVNPDMPEEALKGADEPIGPPMTLGRGGPDTFGYEWIDSDESDGPYYEWVDISANGVEITPWPHGTVDDGYTDPIPMGMDFDFYGITYTDIVISTNGWVSFLPATSSYLTNSTLPNSANPNAIIAVEWDDLDGGTVGHCYYYYDAGNNEFIVSWVGWPYYPDASQPQHDLQVILNGNSGNITTQYANNAGTWQSDVTVGIENETGTDGLQVVYNQAYLRNDFAIQFSTGSEGIAPAHYKLYRAETPNVPILPAYLIAGDIAGELNSYIDTNNLHNGTTYYYKLTAVWTDSVESPPTNEASATPVTGARMAADPLSFTVSGNVGEIETRNLNISNPGGLTLDFNIAPEISMVLRGQSGSPISDHGEDAATEDKDNPANEPENPPMLLSRGGPDDFGYLWIDSDEPSGGPVFNWIDITADGVEITPWPHGTVDDGYTDPIPMGMNFTFYGISYSDIVISTNGWISFLAVTNSYLSNATIPNTANPNAIIAVEWDDLDGGSVGHCYYKYDDVGNRFIVSWVGWPYYPDPADPHDIQVILNSNGSVVAQYANNGGTWQSDVSVGIENEGGTIGLQVAYNQAYLHNDLALRYSAGWLSADPLSGSILAGGNQNVTVIFDATTLEAGDYSGSLILTGHDVNHDVAAITIPVTFHVEGSVGVSDGIMDLPKAFSLGQNYPNPFNPTTEIRFDLPMKTFVNLQIFNVMGQRVRTLVNSEMEAGFKSVRWNGSDDNGRSVASGTYFYILKAEGQTFTKKMTMLK